MAKVSSACSLLDVEIANADPKVEQARVEMLVVESESALLRSSVDSPRLLDLPVVDLAGKYYAAALQTCRHFRYCYLH